MRCDFYKKFFFFYLTERSKVVIIFFTWLIALQRNSHFTEFLFGPKAQNEQSSTCLMFSGYKKGQLIVNNSECIRSIGVFCSQINDSS